MTSNKISLQSAILMSINIMAGAGVFINIVDLTRELSFFGGFLYFIIGCFLFPLIFTIAKLVETFPSGGFYAFGKPMHPFLGFLSCWTYFFGKLASVSLYMHVVTTFLRQLFPYIFGGINPFWINISILTIYILLNCLNMRVGVIIQKIFIIAKATPLIALTVLGVCYFDINLISAYALDTSLNQFIYMLPVALYSFSGFEAACSVSRNLENPEKNAPKAIFYSFFTVVLIYLMFQTLMSFLLKPVIGNLHSYAQAYPYLMSLTPASALIQSKLTTLLSFFIGFSAMGAAYSVLFSNSWNLYTLAENKHTFASKALVTFNRYSIPYLAVIAEGLICVLFLWVTGGNKIPLQQISTLGGTITYTISTLAFLYTTQKSRFPGYLSLLTCSGLITSCILSIIQHDISSLYLFIIMSIFGISMYWANRKK